MHGSGLSHLVDEPLTLEVEGNQIGRAGRQDDSLATLMYDVNDAEARLQDLSRRRPEPVQPQAMSSTSTNSAAGHVVPPQAMQGQVPLFILGPPSRSYYVKHTAGIFHRRGFGPIHWIRALEACELYLIKTDAKTRCMVFWLTTVAPLLQKFWKEEGGTKKKTSGEKEKGQGKGGPGGAFARAPL